MRLPRRGLCAEHSASIARAWEHANPPPPPARPAGPPPPPAREIDPSEIFVANGHVKTETRAQHVARWVARIGAPVLAADAVRVSGLTMGGSASRMLKLAADRGWITRDDRGSVLPGTERP